MGSSERPNGYAARMDLLERRAERAENSRAELWKQAANLQTSVAVIERDLRSMAEHMEAIRAEVEEDAQIRRERDEREEKRKENQKRSTLGWRVALLGAGALLLSSLIASLTALATSGSL